MKAVKNILNVMVLLAVVWSCEENNFDNVDFVNSVVAPANVSAVFEVTQDNTGLVTITPNSEGASSYSIYYGDNTTEPEVVAQGESATHTYGEGSYSIRIVATGLGGKTSEATVPLEVSFKAPENLEVTITNDEAVSKQVNVTATADDALTFEVNFGDGSELVQADIAETASHIYSDAGFYTIVVTAMGAAIETTAFTEIDFEVTAILQPLEPAASPSSTQNNVVSIFSDVYTDIADTNFFPNWGQSTVYTPFDLNGDMMIQYSNLNYEGIDIGSAVDASAMEMLHIDIWTSENLSIDIFPLPGGVTPDDERFVTKQLVANQWNSFDISLTDFTEQGLPLDNLMQFKFVGTPAGETIFIDNLYFWKVATGSSPLIGTWKIAPEEGAISVGPGDGSVWWSMGAADVITRACFFDDEYIFGADGTFQNSLGLETWLEPWQGVDPEACGIPIAPHDGTSSATYVDNGGTVIVTGVGAYIGLPKVHNNGEDGMPVDNTITYDYVLSSGGNILEVTISGFNGGSEVWYFKLMKQ
ncbi:PKD domain-containing protein [Kriegella aquimaris]|uniref:PKD domain-containing protein n=1 Tax=Kriegella aquimaris TaxID=192904 RepID=A0A1G9WZ49_9FLAO|nr:PKD domain-containing protein [Kriegella aquimaris]SDM89476.1 hypothetical protein SAMN04488514_116111 [Kriegella aquimaris]